MNRTLLTRHVSKSIVEEGTLGGDENGRNEAAREIGRFFYREGICVSVWPE